MLDVVAGLILDPCKRLLVCRRPPEKHLGGFWEFPGGKIEPGEDPATALIRELREELGIVVAPCGPPLTPVVHDYGRGPIRLIPIPCTISSGIPHPLEHSEIRWCEAAEILHLDLAAADIPILHEWLATPRAATAPVVRRTP
jgi:8-oxo-dGTP diphosphatase